MNEQLRVVYNNILANINDIAQGKPRRQPPINPDLYDKVASQNLLECLVAKVDINYMVLLERFIDPNITYIFFILKIKCSIFGTKK